MVSDLLGIKSTEQQEGMNAGTGLLPRQQVCCREQVGNPGFLHSSFPSWALRVHSLRDRDRAGQAEEPGGWQEPADSANTFWVSLTVVRVLLPTGFYLWLVTAQPCLLIRSCESSVRVHARIGWGLVGSPVLMGQDVEIQQQGLF